MPNLRWIKSSYSEASGNNCVEIAETGPLVTIRDSKHPERPWATVSPEAWTAFTDTLSKNPPRQPF